MINPTIMIKTRAWSRRPGSLGKPSGPAIDPPRIPRVVLKARGLAKATKKTKGVAIFIY